LTCDPANRIQAIHKNLQIQLPRTIFCFKPAEYNAMNNSEQFYTIQQLSVKLQIPKPTLRFWEKELNRTPGGQRRYSLENAGVIKKIDELRKKGMRIAEIKQKFENTPNEQDCISKSPDIDMIGDKVAAMVKNEIYKFFKMEFDNNFLS
jgi:DNA-binding transcriptional MerR regulator